MHSITKTIAVTNTAQALFTLDDMAAANPVIPADDHLAVLALISNDGGADMRFGGAQVSVTSGIGTLLLGSATRQLEREAGLRLPPGAGTGIYISGTATESYTVTWEPR